MSVALDEEDFAAAVDARVGWCPSCGDFTTPGVRSSEVLRVCVDCGDEGVCGAGHARRAGFVEVES